MNKKNRTPQGKLAIRILAMPANTNPDGDIFGGWIVANMDLASAGLAVEYAQGRVVTVAIESMSFISPVKVGDFICCYADLITIGNTSLKIKVETWAESMHDKKMRLVTEGIFTFVAVSETGKPRPIIKKSTPS